MVGEHNAQLRIMTLNPQCLLQDNASKWLLLSLQLNHTRNKLAVNWLDSLVVDFQSDPMIACYEGSTKNYEFLGAS